MRAVKSLGYAFKPVRSRFKLCGGSKQAVLREKLARKPEDNIGLGQTPQSIVIIISHGGGSCSECWIAHQLGDTIYFHRYQRVTTWFFDKSNGVCFVQRWLVYSAVVLWIVLRQGHLVLVTVSFTILFVPITAMRWPSFGKFVASLTNIPFMMKRNFCPPVPLQAGNRTIMIPRERLILLAKFAMPYRLD